MRILTLITIGVVLLVAASCALTPQRLGDIDEAEITQLQARRDAICAFSEVPGHVQFVSSGVRLELTGYYFLDFSRPTALAEVGKIDVIVDFPGGTESPPRTHNFDIISVTVSRVTGFTPVPVGATVGYNTEVNEFSGGVRVTEPVGTDPIPPAFELTVEGKKTQLVADGAGPGAVRALNLFFEGVFLREFEFGGPEFSVCGDVRDDNSPTRPASRFNGTFYLERR